MCELFAMSSRVPTDARASLAAFARHGGLEAHHKDGWGIAYYADEDVRLVKEAEPASYSKCMRFLDEHPFTSGVVLSHIRRATQGRMAMKNCQPFARELGGRMHVFAHNGDLRFEALRESLPLRHFEPVGDTDSEYAFCALLERMRPLRRHGGVAPLHERLAVVARFAASLRALGPANFLYADADALFIHAHLRSPGAGAAPRPPGLHLLQRRCAPEQSVVLAASVPLTEERGWQALREGELVAAQAGAIVARVRVAPAKAELAVA
jgi:glutamine amidotransferase